MHFSKAYLRLATLAVYTAHIAEASPVNNAQIKLEGDTAAIATLPNKIQQNDSICDAGSAQWTGTVGVGEGRGLFYWYFESRHEPERAPLVIWLNGGPGASSLLGAFHEIGPCKVEDGIKGTKRNELSWNNFANMLFIDQPVGVGFSKTNNTSLWADNLLEGGVDFTRFLDTFLEDLFPELKGRPIHFAGESYGGKYVPVYAAMSHHKFSSLILVDAMVNFPKTITGLYEHLCVRRSTAQPSDVPPKYMNETACAAMQEGYVDCERAARLCDLAYDESICGEALEKCMEVYAIYMAEVVPGGRNPYDDRLQCIDPPMCGQLGMQQVSEYLNTNEVQEALGFHTPFHFEAVNMDFNNKWATQPDVSVPSTREISRLLDHKNTPILVLNGNNDVIMYVLANVGSELADENLAYTWNSNSEGVISIYDDLLWTGHANFKHQSFQPWNFRQINGDVAVAGQFKSTGNLMLVAIDEAGHMSPMDQPIAVAELMQKWLKYGTETKANFEKSRKSSILEEL